MVLAAYTIGTDDVLVGSGTGVQSRACASSGSAGGNFSSRDAIPRLEAAALRADDPAEKKQLEEAAEFLKLPTLTEHLAKQREKAKAR